MEIHEFDFSTLCNFILLLDFQGLTQFIQTAATSAGIATDASLSIITMSDAITTTQKEE